MGYSYDYIGFFPAIGFSGPSKAWMCDAVIFPISAASRRSPQVQPFISNELAPSDSHKNNPPPPIRSPVHLYT